MGALPRNPQPPAAGPVGLRRLGAPPPDPPNLPPIANFWLRAYTYANPNAISNAFNSYFARVGSTTASKIPAPSSKAKRKINSTVDSFFLQPVIETDVVNLLYSLDSSKSTGLHQIPIKFLKLATTAVAPILTDMYNSCVQEGIYPDILKIAQIIPIYKKGDKGKSSNYRPIFLLYLVNKGF